MVARRHPGWLTRVGVYGLAGAVSFSRVTSREHFPADVAVGSALGWLIGRYVSRSAHLPKPGWFQEPATASPGSPYVPMDSWMYAALDRLASFGLIPSQTSGLRPWTRADASARCSKPATGCPARTLLAPGLFLPRSPASWTRCTPNWMAIQPRWVSEYLCIHATA